MNTDTNMNISLLLTRVVLGMIILGHGLQKLFGWFGGFGFEGTVEFFTQTIGLPYLFALFIIGLETIGMFALIAGLFSRVMALGLAIIMLGAIVTVHGANSFFMNWGGALAGEGFEFHLLVISLSLVILINGSGTYSFDHYLKKKQRSAIDRGV